MDKILCKYYSLYVIHFQPVQYNRKNTIYLVLWRIRCFISHLPTKWNFQHFIQSKTIFSLDLKAYPYVSITSAKAWFPTFLWACYASSVRISCGNPLTVMSAYRHTYPSKGKHTKGSNDISPFDRRRWSKRACLLFFWWLSQKETWIVSESLSTSKAC